MYLKIILYISSVPAFLEVRYKISHVWHQHHAGTQKDLGTFGFLDWRCSASTVCHASGSRAVSTPLLLWCVLCVVWCVLLPSAGASRPQCSWEQHFRTQVDVLGCKTEPGFPPWSRLVATEELLRQTPFFLIISFCGHPNENTILESYTFKIPKASAVCHIFIWHIVTFLIPQLCFKDQFFLYT